MKFDLELFLSLKVLFVVCSTNYLRSSLSQSLLEQMMAMDMVAGNGPMPAPEAAAGIRFKDADNGLEKAEIALPTIKVAFVPRKFSCL